MMRNIDRLWILLGFLAVGNEAAGNEWASVLGISMIGLWSVSVTYAVYHAIKEQG